MHLRQALGLLAAVFLFSSCSNQTVDRLFTHYKKDDSAIAATLPGWLVERGLALAFKGEGPEALSQFKDIVQDIKKVRVLVSTDRKPNPYVGSFAKKMTKDNYQLFSMVKKGETNFNFWVKEDQSVVKDIFLFITSEENVVLLQVKGNINMEAVEKIDINRV